MLKKAFTLAEVLITLMIIGVIAAITVPTLRGSADEKQLLAGLNKAYSVADNITRSLEIEHGPVRFWPLDDLSILMDKWYLPKMNIEKNCKNAGGCFGANYSSSCLNGDAGHDFDTDDRFYTFKTADGICWSWVTTSKACDDFDEGRTYLANACGYFQIDVNCSKLPNVIGYDIFGLVLTKEGLFPMGGCPGCDTADCDNKEIGWGCAAKAIMDGKIDW